MSVMALQTVGMPVGAWCPPVVLCIHINPRLAHQGCLSTCLALALCGGGGPSLTGSVIRLSLVLWGYRAGQHIGTEASCTFSAKKLF